MPTFNGPLGICSQYPRYFTDNSNKAIHLTGSHVWHCLKDIGKTDPPEPFDYDAYLDLLESHHHNFMRLWTGNWPIAFSKAHPYGPRHIVFPIDIRRKPESCLYRNFAEL